MRLRSNKGYIQGELNLVDTHDQFDTEIGMISLTSQIHMISLISRKAVMVTFQMGSDSG